ncbi:MAG TPA: hypothetical protein VE825_13720 [Terriglobales bacterium]|jgi:hypothetical protein|nr:hypothetical protein [Terriglobales bacterium]
MRTILIILLLATAAFAQDEAAVARLTQAACGPHETQLDVKVDKARHSMGTAEPGKALVYVIEQEKHRGVKAVTTRVGLDGAWIGANRGDSYFFFSVEPGEHHLCADWRVGVAGGDDQVALASFTAEVGKVYYFRVRTMGAEYMGNILDLDPINSDEGQFLVASSPFSSPPPTRSPSHQ